MRRSRFFLGTPALVVWHVAAGQAATLRVPSEYGTIQAGLDAAVFGDTVLVAPGTYTDISVRFLDGFPWTSCAFLADGVVLRSEEGPVATTIDMQGQGSANQPNVIMAWALPSDETVVDGFTVTGAPFGWSGAWINFGGKVTLRNCVFRDLDLGPIFGGAGITTSDDIDVIDCTFVNCVSVGGGAIYQDDAQIRIIGSTFRECGSTAVGLYFIGGGDVEGALIQDCKFIDNWSSAAGGAIHSTYLGEVTITGCRFEGNVAAGGGGGGAIDIGELGPKSIENCLFLFNRATGIDGEGGAIKVVTFCTIRGSTFYGNSQFSTFTGGAAIASFVADFVLENNVIAASVGGEAVLARRNVVSDCNVFWENLEGNGDGYVLGPTDREVDPLFCDPEGGDFTLMEESPCLPENSGGCGLIGALGQGCGLIAVKERSWGSIKASYRK